nr:MAG: hypothetical protein [Lake Baikal virophage 5]
MNKYQNGKIYRLVCNNTGLNYYGSTVQKLCQRLYEHKRCYKLNKNLNYTSFKIIEGGNFNIILVEEYPCENRYQLEAQERYHIENNECVNKNIPTQTHKEYYESHKEEFKKRSKEYYESHKEEHKIWNKEYNESNKEKIKEQTKKYREANKEKYKLYYEANKEKLIEKQRIRRKNKIM